MYIHASGPDLRCPRDREGFPQDSEKPVNSDLAISRSGVISQANIAALRTLQVTKNSDYTLPIITNACVLKFPLHLRGSLRKEHCGWHILFDSGVTRLARHKHIMGKAQGPKSQNTIKDLRKAAGAKPQQGPVVVKHSRPSARARVIAARREKAAREGASTAPVAIPIASQPAPALSPLGAAPPSVLPAPLQSSALLAPLLAAAPLDQLVADENIGLLHLLDGASSVT